MSQRLFDRWQRRSGLSLFVLQQLVYLTSWSTFLSATNFSGPGRAVSRVCPCVSARSLWAEYLTDDPAAWRVRVGEHHMFSDADQDQVDVDVENIIFHRNRDRKLNHTTPLLGRIAVRGAMRPTVTAVAWSVYLAACKVGGDQMNFSSQRRIKARSGLMLQPWRSVD